VRSKKDALMASNYFLVLMLAMPMS